jgi:uncharacterized SAM-binding protein YcdF (DUF218 family)
VFFILSKVLWLLTAPGNVIALAIWGGMLLMIFGRLRCGRRLVVLGGVALFVCGVLPTGSVLLRGLEDRFPQPALGDLEPTGIIVLGGAIDQVIGKARGQVTITDSATRMTAGAVLARRYPAAKLLYTGGSNALVSQVGSEAADARRLWIDLGVPPAQILVEDKSRNTYENARFSRDLLKPQAGDRYLLVTSAYHMPRAVGLFRAAGFPIVPYPVDYRTTGTWRDFEPNRDVAAGLDRFDVGAREWIGLVAYRLSGKIAEMFPHP